MMGGGLGIIFLLAIIVLVVWALTRVSPTRQGGEGRSGPDGPSAEEVLRERFARGEIDAGEYERSLEVLQRNGKTGPR